jgi:hypothetical protein
LVSSSKVTIAASRTPDRIGCRSERVLELLVGARRGDRRVARTDLQVSSARFAGSLEIPSSVTATHAGLRISDPTQQAGRDVVQQLDLALGS